MCCSPIREAVRAPTHYYTRAWQHVNTRNRLYIVIVIYLPFQHKCLRYNHRTMFRNFRLRACRAIIPLQPAVMVLQPCITKSKQSENNFSPSLVEGLPGCYSIAGLYYSPASLKQTVKGVHYSPFNFYRIDTLGIIVFL